MKKHTASLLLSLSVVGILVVVVVIVLSLVGKPTSQTTLVSTDEYPAPVANNANMGSAFQAAYPPPANQAAYPPPVVAVNPISSTPVLKTQIISDPAYGTITPVLAKPYLDNNQTIFLDVRSAESYSNSHIAGAISIPEAEIPTRIDELDPNKLIILYCS